MYQMCIIILISIKENKQVRKLTPVVKGQNITLTFAMNVTGYFIILPLLIFLRKNGQEL